MIKTIEEFEKILKKYMTNQQASFSKDSDIKKINEFPAANSLNYSENAEIYKCYEDFNELYYILKNGLLDFRPHLLTPRGNLKATFTNYYRGWSCKIIKTTTGLFKGINLLVTIEDKIYKCSFGQKGTAKNKATGYDAYKAFRRICKNYDIDLKQYELTPADGALVKENIPKPIIVKNYAYATQLYKHVNHLDIHSAWPAGVIKKYPEFKPVFEDLYKYDKTYGPKALGYCQSDRCKFKFADLPYYGISWCNNKIRELIDKLQAQNFAVMMVNTDGIWYADCDEQGRLYHDEDEGLEIGQYKNDHVDCDFFAVSEGYYYYVENGKFNPVCRGKYGYEYEKAREEWTEDDFFKALSTCITMNWDDQHGFIVHYSMWEEDITCQEENIIEQE